MKPYCLQHSVVIRLCSGQLQRMNFEYRKRKYDEKFKLNIHFMVLLDFQQQKNIKIYVRLNTGYVRGIKGFYDVKDLANDKQQNQRNKQSL